MDECSPHFAFIASLKDNRWPASHSTRENKSVRQEEIQEGAGDWERKDKKDGCMSRKQHTTDKSYVVQRHEWDKDKKRHTEREQEEEREDRKRTQQSSICSYSVDVLLAWFRETTARYTLKDLIQMLVCIVTSTDFNEGGPYAIHTCHPLKAFTFTCKEDAAT